MSFMSGTAPWGACKALSRSLPVRFVLIPLAGFGVARGTHSGFAGLGTAVVVLVGILVGLKLEDEWRRRREAREHIAGLRRW
jgi:hypothetical protein